MRRRAGGQQRVLEGARPLASQPHRSATDEMASPSSAPASSMDATCCRNCARARRSRDATVPRGRPNVSAMSPMLISSNSNSVNTTRNVSCMLPNDVVKELSHLLASGEELRRG